MLLVPQQDEYERLFTPFGKQKVFMNAVLSGKYKYLLYGGAIRGGKTFVGSAIICLLCKMFPGSRWAIVRSDLPRMRRNLIPSFEKVAPHPFCQRINKYTWSMRCANGSEVLFVTESLRDDPELNRWRGLEVNGFFFDEVNEVSEKAWNKAIERAGSWQIPKQPPIVIIASCNPTQNWVKTKFYTPWSVGELKAPYFYLPANIDDNPHVDEEYKESLKQLPPEEYKRFVEGSWDIDDSINQLITWSAIEGCRAKKRGGGVKSLGIDVSRFGKDLTVYVVMEGPNVIEIYTKESTRTTDVVNDAIILMNTHNIDADNVGVDGVGLGAGVVDGLEEKGYIVQDLIGGAGSVDTAEDYFFSYKNFRAQMAWTLKSEMERLELGGIENDRMRADIGAIQYGFARDKEIQIESKEKITKRIGRSPDYFDGLMYANWVRKRREPVPSVTFI